MPKDQREVRRGVRIPAVRDEEGRITERARTLTDEDEIQKLGKGAVERLSERGAISGFGVVPYGAKGKEDEFEAAGEGTGDAGKSASKAAKKDAK